MGTTLTAVYTIGLDAFIGHVGDSRAYLFHDNSLKQLTCDHTAERLLVKAGILQAGSLEARRLSHVLTNCLGASSQRIRVDVGHILLAYGDSLLLCTDGLTDMVDDEQIAEIMRLHPSPAAACDVLIDLALDRGGKDNITVALARYEMPVQNHLERINRGTAQD